MKKLICALLAFVMCLSMCTVSFADDITFSDVDKTSALGESVYKLVSAGIINGYEDGTFKPDAHLTRAELCKMVNLTFGFTVAADNIFTDVKADDWYYVQVLYAVNKGYIKGFEDNTFRGDDNVSREQVCTILDRILELKSDKEVKISDEVSDWAQSSVEKMIANGYMPIENGDTFRATADITRGELAQALKFFVKDSADTKDDTKADDTKTNGDKKDDSKGSTSTGGSKGNSGSNGNSGNNGSSSDDDGKLPSQDDDPTPTPKPEPSKPTAEEIAASNTACNELDTVLADIELIEFKGDAATIIGYIKKDIEETLDAAYDEKSTAEDKGVIVNEQYVRKTYAKDIDAIKAIIDAMDENGKAEFKKEILKINTSSLTYLTKYFNINMEYFN